MPILARKMALFVAREEQPKKSFDMSLFWSRVLKLSTRCTQCISVSAINCWLEFGDESEYNEIKKASFSKPSKFYSLLWVKWKVGPDHVS